MTTSPLPPRIPALGERWQRQVQRSLDHTALICGDDSITYRELDARVTQVAQGFLAEGVQPGDRLAFSWFNEINAVVLYLACFRAGLIAVPIIWRVKPPELAYILDHARPALCLAQPQLAPLFEQALALGAPPIRLLQELPTASAPSLPVVNSGQPALIVYTSGTTARPKGVIHSHASLGAGVEMIGDIMAAKLVVTTTSLLHGSGLIIVTLPALFNGGTVVLIPTFDPAVVLDAIERWRANFLFLLPSMAQLVIVEQTKRARNVASLEFVASGGDSVPLATHEAFRAAFGVPLCEGLALTECVPLLVSRPNNVRPGSVGMKEAGVEVRILDRHGAPVLPGETGELVVRSPAAFMGYWKNPAETELSLRDGWVYTGDLVRVDDTGHYYFQGRKKQLIVREGYNISPQEVEEALCRHPAVFMAGVFGLPDPLYGEQVVAAVALRPGHAATESELREFMSRQLNELKVPGKILFLSALPLNPVGKVDRRSLKEKSEKDLASPAT